MRMIGDDVVGSLALGSGPETLVTFRGLRFSLFLAEGADVLAEGADAVEGEFGDGIPPALIPEKDAPFSRAVDRAGHILCRPILGGLHHQYARI